MKSYGEIIREESSTVADQVGRQHDRVAQRLASVRTVVAVMSGKGGVGKSTIASNLAAALAERGRSVGLVDADVNGSSIVRMTGIRRTRVRVGQTGILPAVTRAGVKIMSVDLFLAGDDTPVVWDAPTQKDGFTWRGAMEAAALREFISDTEWGALDVLAVDLPPGADKLPTLADIVPNISGTVVVTIPSDVSRHVVGKSIRLARDQLKTPVIGLVENMSSYVCPHCGEGEDLFPPGGTETWAESYGIPVLGRIPFDPEFGRANDRGGVSRALRSERPAGRVLARIADEVDDFLF